MADGRAQFAHQSRYLEQLKYREEISSEAPRMLRHRQFSVSGGLHSSGPNGGPKFESGFNPGATTHQILGCPERRTRQADDRCRRPYVFLVQRAAGWQSIVGGDAER